MFVFELKLGPDGLTSESTKHFRKKLYPILHKFFQKSEEKGLLPKSFYEAYITLISTPDKNSNKIKKL